MRPPTNNCVDGVSTLDTEDSLKTTRRATVRPPIVDCGDSDMDDDAADPDFEPSKKPRSSSSYAKMLRKARVARKAERSIESDEESAVSPPPTTHRYNYTLDNTAPFNKLPLFNRFREYLSEHLVKAKKNADMIVSKAKAIMWFANGNTQESPECNLSLLNKTSICEFKRHLESLNFANSTIRMYLLATFTFI